MTYLIFNLALAAAYLIARCVLQLPFIKHGLSQYQQLQCARYCLIFAITVFMVMPDISALLPSSYHTSFELEPFVKSASDNFIGQVNATNHPSMLPRITDTYFSFYYVFVVVLLAGIGASLIKYSKEFSRLNAFKKKSYCQHRLKNIHILFNDECNIPFCWGYLNRHFILLPNTLLTRHSDVKLALRHELQHIRQGDTHWLHLMRILQCICFWNPFIRLWIKWLDELQELSCDETIILKRKNTAPADYAQCLLNAAKDSLAGVPQGVLGIHKLSKSFLHRRVNMIFSYQNFKARKLSSIIAYFILFFTSLTAAFALNGSSSTSPLSVSEVTELIQKAHLDTNFSVAATPEVVNEINNIRASKQARTYMRAALHRMKKYQPIIEAALKQSNLPKELLVIPLVESGYQPLDQSKNRMLAAGIWQIIPGTAKRYDLTINDQRDDRLNTQLSTNAALAYLKSNHELFKDWKLAAIAYEIGEVHTQRLIKETGSRDAWELANASSAPAGLKKFIVMLDASLIILHNPDLV